jgi:hypothetical protein
MLWLLLACQVDEVVSVTKGDDLSQDVEIGLIYSNALVGEIEPCG